MTNRVQRRVLLTGHLGYVGSVLSPMLSDFGYCVTGCDIDLYQACAVAEMPASIPVITADFRDLSVDDLGNIDTVIHLAGLSNDPLGELDANLTDEINYRAAAQLAARARAAGVRRFIAASSCSVYGASGERWLDERSKIAPLTAYARAKHQLELALLEESKRGLDVVILRPGTVFGFSPKLRFDLVVNNLAAWAMTTGRLHMKSTGNAWRPLLHVNDLCRAIVALIEANLSELDSPVLNIGFNDLNLTVHELALELLKHLPNVQLAIADDAEPDRRSYRVNCSKLKQLLPDWCPSRRPIAVIDELRPLLNNGWLTAQRFEGPDLARAGHLRQRIARGEVSRDLRAGRLSPDRDD